MLTIHLQDISKRFQYEWIFRKVSLTFRANQIYTITGANGSGKSTLLQIIAGMIQASEGGISYQVADKQLSAEDWYKHISFASPYMELIEEFTLTELVKFHFQFKKIRQNLSAKDLIQQIGLEQAKHKYIKHFSSGMKQRVKLGLAFYSDTPIVLLDEPTSNLDGQGIAWYLTEIQQNLSNRLCILCSNQPYEYEFCRNIVDISHFKV
jgi:ABC-type multidrug transport system ATPase subunit